MESSNLHNHQLQLHQHDHHQLVGSSPNIQTPSFYGVGTNHAWTPSTILNSGNLDPHIIINSNSRDSRQQNDILVPSHNNSMIQDLGFHWDSNRGSFTNHTNHDLQLLGRVKEELSLSDSYTKMMNSASNIEDYHLYPRTYLKNEHKNLNDLSDEKLLLGTFSSSAGEYYFNAQNYPSKGNFSQIFPTVNVSDLNQSSQEISRPSDMNLEALDLINSSRFCGNFLSQPNKHVGLFKESLSNYGLEDHMQQSIHRTSNNPSKISPFTNGVTEAKRPSSLLESKANQTATKKSRVEPRSSCPPFKVRKEKLGDRIAALQQMVAPFGKVQTYMKRTNFRNLKSETARYISPRDHDYLTDTASVLMEAIGYIKFLQNQVETLSVPYMKSSCGKASRTMKGDLTEEGSEEPKRDLRSRGLCLVPLSCMSYVADGGGIWPPPNFSAGT